MALVGNTTIFNVSTPSRPKRPSLSDLRLWWGVGRVEERIAGFTFGTVVGGGGFGQESRFYALFISLLAAQLPLCHPPYLGPSAKCLRRVADCGFFL